MSVRFRAPDGSIVTLPGPFDPVPPCPYCAPDEKCAICLGMEGLFAAAWDETKHPRHPKGEREGGRFARVAHVASPVIPQLYTELKDTEMEERLKYAYEDSLPRGGGQGKPPTPGSVVMESPEQEQMVRDALERIEERATRNGDNLVAWPTRRLLKEERIGVDIAPPEDTFVGLQGYERGPGRVVIEGERPRMPTSEVFAHPYQELGAAVTDWEHLRELDPDKELVPVSELVPTQDQMSAVRIQEYVQELQEDGNLDELLDTVRIVEGDDGRLYVADGHNRVAAAIELGHRNLPLPVIRSTVAREMLEGQAVMAAAGDSAELTVEQFNDAVEAAAGSLDRFEPKLTRIYERAIKELGRQLAARFVRLAPDAVAAAATPPADWTPPTVAELLAVQEDILETAATEARTVQVAAFEAMVDGVLRRIGISFEVRAILTQALLNGLGARAIEMIEGIRVPVARAIANSYLNGLSVPQTADAIQEAVDGLTKTQATMLARNDLVGLANGGSLTSARLVREKFPEVGLAYKEWLATPDERTRPTHVEAHGQRVPLETPFAVGEAQLAYPGDPTGPDAEVINCRCTLIYRSEPALTASSVVEKIQQLTAAFVEGQHPRDPGGDKGGEFIKKGTTAEGGSTAPDDRSLMPWKGTLSKLHEFTAADVKAGKVPGIVEAELREGVAAHAREAFITVRAGEFGEGIYKADGSIDTILVAHEAGHYVANEIQRESKSGMSIPELEPFRADPGYTVIDAKPNQYGRIRIKRDNGVEESIFPRPSPYENPWGINPDPSEILADTYAELLHAEPLTPEQVKEEPDFNGPRKALLDRVAKTAAKMGLPHKRLYRAKEKGPNELVGAVAWDETKHPRDPGGEGGGQFIKKGTTAPGGEPEKSEGHLLFADKWEYFVFGDDVLRAPLDAPIRADVPYRNGARFEFPVSQIATRQEQGVYPFTQQTFAVEKADVSAMHVDPELQGVWHEDGGELVYEADKPGLLETPTIGRKAEAMWKATRHTPTGEWKFWTVNTWGNPHHDTVEARVGWHWNATARYSGAGMMSARDDDGTTPLNPELQALLDRHARTLRDAKELAEMHESMAASGDVVCVIEWTPEGLVAAAWDPTKHPRHPAGSALGGEFAPKPYYYGARVVREGGGETGQVIGYQAFRMERGHGKGSIEGRTDAGVVRETLEEAAEDARVAFEDEERARAEGVPTDELLYEQWLAARRKVLAAAAWDPIKHPRHPAGSEAGGEFAPKGTPASRGELTVEEEQAAYEARMREELYPFTPKLTGDELAARVAETEDFLAELQTDRVATDPPWLVEMPPSVSANVEVDYGPARAEFEDWAAGMEQWYTEREGFTPDYWPTERDELWRRYETAVAVELDPLRERLAQTGITGLTIQPQLSSASGGDMDVILDPQRELTPDFNIEMRADPDAHRTLRPGVTLWTRPGDDIVEDIIPLDDRDFFPGGPESETAVAYVSLIDAVAGRPRVDDPTPVTMYRGMSDREIDAWEAGDEIPAGKFFTSRPTAAYAQDIAGEPPVLQAYRIPRSLLIEVAPGEFQLRKRAKMEGGHIRPVTAAGIWDEQKHPRHSAGSEQGGEFAPKDGGIPEGSIAVTEAVNDRTEQFLSSMRRRKPLGLAGMHEQLLTKAEASQAAVGETLAKLSELHALPFDVDRIVVRLDDSIPLGRLGEHHRELVLNDSPVPYYRSTELKLHPFSEPAFVPGVVAHEFGHYLDVQLAAFADEDGVAHDIFTDLPDAAGWRQAVHETEAVKGLKRIRDNDPDYINYLVSDEELWARSYAQWAATRLDDDEMLASVRGPGNRSGLPNRQWDDVDFGPVGREIDKIMGRNALVRRRAGG